MVRPKLELSSQEARGVVLAAQGLGRPRRTSRVGRRQLRAVINAVGVIQLDAINVLERTQFLVPFSRVGEYDVRRLHAMAGPGGELFEYWGHAASLLPTVQQPLFRWRMAQHGPVGDSPTYSARREAWRAANADYIAVVLGEVRDRGPLSASQLADPRRRAGQWWERRSLGRLALEWMFTRGQLAAWRTPSFERVYDLPERVFPEAVLSQPTPPVEEAHRRLLARTLLHDARNQVGAAEPRPRHPAIAVRLPHLGPRTNAAPVRLRLPHRGLRPGKGPATRLLRAAPTARRPTRRSARPEGRPEGVGTARPGGPRRARHGRRDCRSRGGNRARFRPELAAPR